MGSGGAVDTNDSRNSNGSTLTPALSLKGRGGKFRPGRSPIAVLIYLVGYVVLLVFVSWYYLFPALVATRGADPLQRKLLSAHATMILALVLFILMAGLLLTFRIGRFFRPRQSPPGKPTEYIDAWTESARRMKTPEEEE
ncbi:MAG: hypothetical protein JWO87_4079 [Phycisphaerales bacterium]|nr:hypothetical protein [Phycisphaerales bacterium]